jgi:hypothetical protein
MPWPKIPIAPVSPPFDWRNINLPVPLMRTAKKGK